MTGTRRGSHWSRRVALALALLLLLFPGAASLHHHHSGDSPQVPPGATVSGPSCVHHPTRDHLDTGHAQPTTCWHCLAALEASGASPTAAPALPSLAPGLPRTAEAPAPVHEAPFAPTPGRGPPSC